MIYQVSLNTTKENITHYQSIKIEVDSIEELFEKILSVYFLFNNSFLDSITINQEVNREYSRSKREKE